MAIPGFIKPRRLCVSYMTTISVNRSKNQKKNSGGYPPGPLTVARSFPSPQKTPV